MDAEKIKEAKRVYGKATLLYKSAWDAQVMAIYEYQAEEVTLCAYNAILEYAQQATVARGQAYEELQAAYLSPGETTTLMMQGVADRQEAEMEGDNEYVLLAGDIENIELGKEAFEVGPVLVSDPEKITSEEVERGR